MPLSDVWLACLEQAWIAYCHGSVPVGAVWVDSHGNVRWHGRNRIYEASADPPYLFGSRLAHAEMNVLVQVSPEDYSLMATGQLYTSLEPCPLCVGAIVMSGVRQVHYGARDREAGSIVLVTGTPYIENKHIKALGPYPEVQTISLVLMTDHLLRLNTPRTPDFIRSFQQDDPWSVALANEWFSTHYLAKAANERWSINRVIEAIQSALGKG